MYFLARYCTPNVQEWDDTKVASISIVGIRNKILTVLLPQRIQNGGLRETLNVLELKESWNPAPPGPMTLRFTKKLKEIILHFY